MHLIQKLTKWRENVAAETIAVCKDQKYLVNGQEIGITLPSPSVKIDGLPFLGLGLKKKNSQVLVLNADMLDIAQDLTEKGWRPLVLNMANEFQPGGGWLHGAGAQEENMFRRSTYHLTLRQHMYPIVSAIYSPDIHVFRGNEKSGYPFLPRPFSVASIAVPAIDRPQLLDGHYSPRDVGIITQRLLTLFRTAKLYKHKALVLGAWGCGAFRNPPQEIASMFKAILASAEFDGAFDLVVFAILEDSNSSRNPRGNFAPFYETFTT